MLARDNAKTWIGFRTFPRREEYDNPSSQYNTMGATRIQCRFQSTYRRMTRANAMASATSMRTSKISGPQSSHIIFNPPPTLPNVYHTPLKFLPANDPRRKLYATGPSLYNIPSTVNDPISRAHGLSKATGEIQNTIMSTPGTSLREVAFSFPTALGQRIPDGQRLPPKVGRTFKIEKYLTQDEVEQIRQLRQENPLNNTVNKLAAQFGCSRELVMGIQNASWKVKQMRWKERDDVKAEWSRKTKLARRDRDRRKELWGRDA